MSKFKIEMEFDEKGFPTPKEMEIEGSVKVILATLGTTTLLVLKDIADKQQGKISYEELVESYITLLGKGKDKVQDRYEDNKS